MMMNSVSADVSGGYTTEMNEVISLGWYGVLI